VDDQELKLALDLAVKYRQRLANWLHASGRIRKLEKHKKEDCGEEHQVSPLGWRDAWFKDE